MWSCQQNKLVAELLSATVGVARYVNEMLQKYSVQKLISLNITRNTVGLSVSHNAHCQHPRKLCRPTNHTPNASAANATVLGTSAVAALTLVSTLVLPKICLPLAPL